MQLSKKHHPDAPGGSAAKFHEINDAYAILGDENKRYVQHSASHTVRGSARSSLMQSASDTSGGSMTSPSRPLDPTHPATQASTPTLHTCAVPPDPTLHGAAPRRAHRPPAVLRQVQAVTTIPLAVARPQTTTLALHIPVRGVQLARGAHSMLMPERRRIRLDGRVRVNGRGVLERDRRGRMNTRMIRAWAGLRW